MFSIGRPPRASRRFSQRDLSAMTYDASVKTNYILIGILTMLAAHTGNVLGSPPLQTFAEAFTLVAVITAGLVLWKRRVSLPPAETGIVSASIAVLVAALVFGAGIDSLVGSLMWLALIGFGLCILWWALTTSVLQDVERAQDRRPPHEDGPRPGAPRSGRGQ